MLVRDRLHRRRAVAAGMPPKRRAGKIIYGISTKFTPLRGAKITNAQAPEGRRAGEGCVTGQEQVHPHLQKTIVLVGMMGAGKTAVGTALARALRVPFHDSDEEIVKAAQRSVAEIFERDGEPFFRARESEVIARLLAGTPGVVSTGGGAFLSEANRAMIARLGVSVWLQADLELLWTRVKGKTTRPLLRTPDPKGTLAELIERRYPVYALAQVAVAAEPGLSIEQMAQKVIEALRGHPGLFAED